MSQLILGAYLDGVPKKPQNLMINRIHHFFQENLPGRSHKALPEERKYGFLIDLCRILHKAECHRTYADKVEVEKFFSKVGTLWTIQLKKESDDVKSISLSFLKEERPSSLFLNPILSNLRAFAEDMNKEFHRNENSTIIKFTTIDNLEMRTTFHHQRVEQGIKEIVESVAKLTRKVYLFNYDGETTTKAVEDSCMLYRNEPCPSPPENTKFERISVAPQKGFYNIRILDSDSKEKDEGGEKHAYTYNRCQMVDVEVEAKIRVTDSSEEIEDDRVFNVKGLKKLPKAFFKEKYYLHYEINNMYNLRNVLKHRNIGSFYLKKKKDSKRMEEFVYSLKYGYSLEDFCREQKLEVDKCFKNILTLIGQLLEALCFLQEKNLIHCDIKPENIMVDCKHSSRFALKIIDIGGMVNVRDPQLGVEPGDEKQYREQLSTTKFFYPKMGNSKEGYWMHPNFDIYGFGKTARKILSLKKLAENIVHTEFERNYRELKGMCEECLGDPNELTGFQTYRGRVESIMKGVEGRFERHR